MRPSGRALLVAASYPGTVRPAAAAARRAEPTSGLRIARAPPRSRWPSDRPTSTSFASWSSRGLDPGALTPSARRIGLARNDRPTVDYLMSKGLARSRMGCSRRPPGSPPNWLPAGSRLGASVNASNAAQYGRTPLLTAVTSEAAGADTLKLLLDRGADPNVPTTEGETPLDWAIYKGDRAKIQVLEQRGAMRGNGPRREEIAPPAEGRHRRPARVPQSQRGAPPRRRATLRRAGHLRLLSPQRIAGDGRGHGSTKGHRGG